ncbi:xanthine dehydrogenase family protein molybdopterin-binding subunit [Parapusillimonas granuli]|uniref:Molybdopterin-dependent oxidoreductase n=1 Tax=Parapusillimonas granuli TaxID=380911 RepID=A0A853G0P0_9BURK|nr:molybdopterin cofactor-binding domain-containing protein [Parapusillimonas granuli]MBB5215134.1 2-furoyl-CoA dehydrogenase large subunit [Parapusillimonas granuli]MEB2401441.1 molybdopterin-dependent oxidoreductase [Alcaligenaceae bacterium]NYT49452.1 molybdopterin-dependent oxidoreductase [Parapusillimonas granuli]
MQQQVEDRTGAAAAERPHVGRRAERIEDATLLTGRGRYGDDVGVKPGTLYAAVVRSPHAHARLLGVNAQAALALPGVRTVLTGEDVRAWSRPFVVGVKQPMEQWALAMDRVRYVGEPVAVVVAESRYIAEDGADLVEAAYEPLPVAVEIEQALSGDAPVLHDKVGGNVVSERNFSYGNPDQAFATAAHRIELTAKYPRNSCTPIEGAVVIAEYISPEDGYEASSNFMGPFSLHTVMALALNVPGTQLRHRGFRDSGGSFGVKQAVFPYIVLMCLAARKAGAPVKWVEDRLEHLVAATTATGRLTRLEAAVDAEGRIIALDYDQVDDCGAYLRAPEPASFYRMHGVLTGAYAIRHLKVRNRILLTNKMPTGLVRGFGGPQVYFMLERLMQRISVELGIDPLTVYRRNFVRPDAFPYRAIAGALLDSGDYERLMDKAVAQGGLDELCQRRAAARAEGRLYGIGFCAIVEPSISNMGYITIALTPEMRAKAGPKNGAIAAATISVDPLGGLTVVVASSPAGQGHRTVCAQVAADVFGLDPGQITVNVDFDTQKDAWSVAAGNYSSRFAGAVAGTVHLAATRLRDKLARIAARQLDCRPDELEFRDGKIQVKGDASRSLPFTRTAGSSHWAPGLLPEGMEPPVRETVFWTPEQLTPPDEEERVNTSAAYSFTFDFCGVEVDRDTGRVRIDRYVTGHDAGRLLNPALADGQIRGAFAQGLGAALMEEFQYGPDGSFLSGTFADYLVPTSCEVPEPVIVHQETWSPFTPLGAKGLGEGNNMSTPPCIANAVADALSVKDLMLPLTPSRVMDLIGIEDPPSTRAPADAAPPPAKGGKALTASGEVQLAADREAVFAVLLDPNALAKVIPGCNALQSTGKNRYKADVTVGIGMIKARYAAEVSLSELDPPNSLRLSGAGLSSVGSAQGTGMVRLESNAGGTLLKYDYEAQVSGKVAAVGGRMLEGAARIVLGQLFEQLGRQASGGGAAKARLSLWARLLRFLRRAK